MIEVGYPAGIPVGKVGGIVFGDETMKGRYVPLPGIRAKIKYGDFARMGGLGKCHGKFANDLIAREAASSFVSWDAGKESSFSIQFSGQDIRDFMVSLNSRNADRDPTAVAAEFAAMTSEGAPATVHMNERKFNDYLRGTKIGFDTG